ncbi:unnamed protein product [Lactuca virosa]|uniref:F-box domain-containing protein n=1 Tax=Lactuca virosa TaxID=75947 RepID=A0AAU9LJF3_9ASTR|nr:unnamed protein product [Lactuca virosa]
MEFDEDNVRPEEEEEEEEEEDRLSKLPDEVIRNILSCIDMKFGVQTCLLSTRWRLVWTSIHCLNFSRREFGCFPKFSEFVTNVLSKCDHQMQVSSINLLLFLREASLTTLYLSDFILVSHKTTKDSLHDNIFTKCVNLKNLTLCWFDLVGGVEVFDIVATRLSNLILIHGRYVKVMNMIAPQLENLTITDTSLEYLNAPSGVPSLCYKGDPPLQLSKDRFHSLNQVIICLGCYPHFGDARKIINILQELRSASYLTLNVEIIEETLGPAFMPTNWWRYVRKYTFNPSSDIVYDRHVSRKNKKDKKKKKKMKKKLSRMDVVMVIQMAFRSYVIRRSQALCALRELAVAKGKCLKISRRNDPKGNNTYGICIVSAFSTSMLC